VETRFGTKVTLPAKKLSLDINAKYADNDFPKLVEGAVHEPAD
jgi:hypothetical protein